MNISVGVMAYNEESNIGNLLNAILNQKTKKANIKEIIVVSSGSTDKTNEIVNNFSKKNKKIKLIVEKERKGKSEAINLFLKKAKSKILVLESADTIPEINSIENLCSRLSSPKVGIGTGRFIPIKSNKKLMNFIVQLQWKLHHLISKENPKFGELIAFRNIINKIPRTAVDEEEIASIIKKKGLKLIYEPKAIVYNKGPETIKDFIRQRRRIYAGHLELRKRTNHSASTMNKTLLLKTVIKYSFRNISKILHLLIAIILETIARFLGWIDFKVKKDHSIWKISITTKKIR
ncbi:MAG: glycosyltransferase [DPANN group archaeon]|nr:glycosyltransferase [DPANN group archaeon]